MNQGTLTIITVGIAAITAIGAYSMRPKELPPAAFEDTGTALFEGFTDPGVATSLEVKTFDGEEAKVKRFQVEQKEGRWVIPSHHDYPADATEKMGKAAASFIDRKKDLYYGDKVTDHGSFGVLDPEGAEGEAEDKGSRITIKDASGTVLVDIIVGKQIPEKQGYRYVRFPDQKRVYGSELEVDISTNFTDWIEKDLLRLKSNEVVTFVYDPYKVDEKVGKVVGSDVLRADQIDEEGKKSWKLGEVEVSRIKEGPDGQPQEVELIKQAVVVPEGKQLDDAKVRQVVGAISRLRIVGVRPRPNPLTLQALQAHGFFVTPDGRRLFGNEGEARAVTTDGLVYTLYFGEITFESGLALTSGKSEGKTAPEPDEAGTGGEAEDEKQANRYLFVDVRYEPGMDKSLEGGESEGPDAAPDPASAADKQQKGDAKAKQLQGRFGEWFFVISDDSFGQIHKPRDEFFKDVEPEKDDTEKPPPGP